MTPAGKREGLVPETNGAHHFEHITKRYHAAWQAALAGGAAPSADTFLEGLQGADRTQLQTQLTEIDQTYRRRMDTAGLNANTTVDLSDGRSGKPAPNSDTTAEIVPSPIFLVFIGPS